MNREQQHDTADAPVAPAQLTLDAPPARLAELEAVVERGLTTFVEVGRALMEIRDSRLYRASHATFEMYCAERWHFTASRGRQLISAAEVAGVLETATRVTLPTERHARELAPLVAAQGPEAAAKLYEGLQEPTVAQLREAVRAEMDGSPASPTQSEVPTPTTLPECDRMIREAIAIYGSVMGLVLAGKRHEAAIAFVRAARIGESCEGEYSRLVYRYVELVGAAGDDDRQTAGARLKSYIDHPFSSPPLLLLQAGAAAASAFDGEDDFLDALGVEERIRPAVAALAELHLSGHGAEADKLVADRIAELEGTR